MYRRILVPVDGSATSKAGLRHALGLAKDLRARVRVLNVLDTLGFAPMLDGYSVADITVLIDSMKASGRKTLDEAIALAKKSGISADVAMMEGRGRAVSGAILEDAGKFRADLIVMGMHGRRGLNRLLLGSDAERVLREAPMPVLLVRQQQPQRRRARKA